jgi:hypothetical protein
MRRGMIRYFFSGATGRREELLFAATRLERLVENVEVVSRWIFRAPDADDYTWNDAVEDLKDVLEASVMVSFTGGGRGGRHVEFGYAVGVDRPITGGPRRFVLIGAKEHIFHEKPGLEIYPDFSAFLDEEMRQNLNPPHRP